MANLDTCTPSTFDGISLFGAEIVQLLAEPVTGYNVNATEIDRLTQPAIVADDISFCNVTVSYTHPNQDDHIIVETWMPATDAWNSRLQSVGGGGLVGGRLPASYATMNGALAEGYIASTTDAGAPVVEPGREIDWALESPGTVKFWNLENFGSKAYGEQVGFIPPPPPFFSWGFPMMNTNNPFSHVETQAVLVKSLAKTFYGKEPDYSYWNGCSTGGRQGLALAQRYPDAYDGIAAGAPAVSTTKLYGGLPWAQMFMIFNEAFPHRCELEALRLAAIEACDGLDGVKDGVVAEYGLCFDEFDPFSHVGEEIDCGSTDAGEGKMKISGDAAAVANASWHGIETVDGRKMGLGGMGFTHQAPLQFAQTNCTGSGACTGDVNYLILLYYAALVTADPDFNVLDATHEELDQLNYVANEKLSSFLNTDNPDLSSFHGAGGKVIVWHGTVSLCNQD